MLTPTVSISEPSGEPQVKADMGEPRSEMFGDDLVLGRSLIQMALGAESKNDEESDESTGVRSRPEVMPEETGRWVDHVLNLRNNVGLL
jgi:hypothetical protein